jgi:polyribonucleotide 5'-hydroxyl-kinase
MAIPGLALPGLSLTNNSPSSSISTLPTTKSVQTLTPESEYRFESSFTRPITLKLLSGSAELFGTDLAPQVAYTFRGTKAAVFSWSGCSLEVTGGRTEDYVADETPMGQYANVHFALEDARAQAEAEDGMGPRLMLVGPENVGKTAVAKILAAYAVKQERRPVFVNLDPKEGALSVPGAATATVIGSVLDVEEGWGSSPVSGPSAVPVKTPLCYHFGCADVLQNARLFKACVTRLGLAVSSRYQEDSEVKSSGCVIDTPGALGTGKPGAIDILQHIVGEFSSPSFLFQTHLCSLSRLTFHHSKRNPPPRCT